MQLRKSSWWCIDFHNLKGFFSLLYFGRLKYWCCSWQITCYRPRPNHWLNSTYIMRIGATMMLQFWITRLMFYQSLSLLSCLDIAKSCMGCWWIFCDYNLLNFAQTTAPETHRKNRVTSLLESVWKFAIKLPSHPCLRKQSRVHIYSGLLFTNDSLCQAMVYTAEENIVPRTRGIQCKMTSPHDTIRCLPAW